MKNIPDFTNRDYLPKGVHITTGDEFINHFCNSDYRRQFIKSISDILDYAVQRGSEYVFFGGSFISNNNKPNDIDCLIVFSKDKHIPSRTDRLMIEGVKLDIMFASLENKNIVNSYVRLLTNSRVDEEIGIVQIDLYNENKKWIIKQPGYEDYEIVKRAYLNRHFIDLRKPKGILVTVHGLLSSAEWNKEIAPIASSEGWIVAPYIYKGNTPELLINRHKRHNIVDLFREWIHELSDRFNYNYEDNISIIAHSFGTYILASYLEGFEKPPVKFNSIILTGSIINSNFDWEKHRGINIGRVLNERTLNDQWVKSITNSNIKTLWGMDKLMGKSGVDGFDKKSEILTESTNNIFTHNNVIRRDVIQSKWMPYLNANRNSYEEEWIKGT
ncbi:DUF6932 family protein [Radiobacillus sp. PE A8.2]|uniref:DUF6932 family protein n=1 Tax=Radiobacillus sp. PE A8.2 TaxID=3380349 RepID=UPI00388DE34D